MLLKMDETPTTESSCDGAQCTQAPGCLHSAVGQTMQLNNNTTAVKERHQITIIDLPTEILIHLYGFITRDDLKRVSQTCKALHESTIVPSLYRGCIFPLYISRSMSYNLSPRKVDYINSRKISKISLKSTFYEFSRDLLNAGRCYEEVIQENLSFNVPLMNPIEKHLTQVRLDPYMHGDMIPKFIVECKNIESLEMYIGYTLKSISESEDKDKIRRCLSRLPQLHLIVYECLSESACDRIMQDIPKLSSLSFDTDDPIKVTMNPLRKMVRLHFEGEFPLITRSSKLLELYHRFRCEFRCSKLINDTNPDLPAFLALLVKSTDVRDIQWPPEDRLEAEP